MTNTQSSIIALNTLLNSFINDTNEKFVDYENALAEIEQNFEINTNDVNIMTEEIVDTNVVEIDETMNDGNVITNDLESVEASESI